MSHNKPLTLPVDDDQVFRALGSAVRRNILDIIRAEPGISLNEISDQFDMSRFGVRKHLEVLVEAGLISVEKEGRVKRHYMNPVPIQSIYDRWLTRYSARWAAALTGLKYHLEDENQAMNELKLRYEIYIRTSAERLWQAITDGELTRKYYYGAPVKSSFEPGASIEYLNHEDPSKVMISGKIVEADAPRRLVHTFDFGKGDGPSTVTYEIEPMGEVCKLTLVHEFDEVNDTYNGVKGGWNPILSGLKTFLETGDILQIPMPG